MAGRTSDSGKRLCWISEHWQTRQLSHGKGDTSIGVRRTLYSVSLTWWAPLSPIHGDLSQVPSWTTWLQCPNATFVPLTKQTAHQSSAHMSCPLPVLPVAARMRHYSKEISHPRLPTGKILAPGIVAKGQIPAAWEKPHGHHATLPAAFTHCVICSIVIEPYYMLNTVLQIQGSKIRVSTEDQINEWMGLFIHSMNIYWASSICQILF